MVPWSRSKASKWYTTQGLLFKGKTDKILLDTEDSDEPPDWGRPWAGDVFLGTLGPSRQRCGESDASRKQWTGNAAHLLLRNTALPDTGSTVSWSNLSIDQDSVWKSQSSYCKGNYILEFRVNGKLNHVAFGGIVFFRKMIWWYMMYFISHLIFGIW